jgi:hypothetical protein
LIYFQEESETWVLKPEKGENPKRPGKTVWGWLNDWSMAKGPGAWRKNFIQPSKRPAELGLKICLKAEAWLKRYGA